VNEFTIPHSYWLHVLKYYTSSNIPFYSEVNSKLPAGGNSAYASGAIHFSLIRARQSRMTTVL